jgi:hypothetical protein
MYSGCFWRFHTLLKTPIDIIGETQKYLQYAPNEHIMVSNHSLLSNACCMRGNMVDHRNEELEKARDNGI